MSSQSVDRVFWDAGEAESDRQWSNDHPIRAWVGYVMDRIALFCGTHAAGYVAPLPLGPLPR
ncbi:hypothetical protein HKX42_02050 [Salinisphaera sp. USBA-960]|uniref:hypothetical protein n=1 Tax=Salinisphaera orenii TaxID=856731 RepID=UPI000DBE2968|nr:hypothetical protein [Salifodinibacter halophilus]NNC25658.1 hypothetical protein [Salifodinibacter halophilus]